MRPSQEGAAGRASVYALSPPPVLPLPLSLLFLIMRQSSMMSAAMRKVQPPPKDR